jgi:hypothetical protein
MKASEKIQDKATGKKMLVVVDSSEGEPEDIPYAELNDDNA